MNTFNSIIAVTWITYSYILDFLDSQAHSPVQKHKYWQNGANNIVNTRRSGLQYGKGQSDGIYLHIFLRSNFLCRYAVWVNVDFYTSELRKSKPLERAYEDDVEKQVAPPEILSGKNDQNFLLMSAFFFSFL